MNEKEKIYHKITQTEVTPEDGIVDKREIYPDSFDEKGLFYGYGKNVSYETNDPRVALPFIYAICSIFFIVGSIIIFASVLSGFYPIAIFGLIFVVVSSYALIVASKDIRNIAEKHNIEVDFGLVYNLSIGYKMISRILLWPIRTLIETLKK